MHTNKIDYAYKQHYTVCIGDTMRTTLNLSEALISEAMRLTNISQKTRLITVALENLIQREKIKGLKEYAGKIDLGIDLDTMRKR
jgi:Arc/MetJ family transcription regulator